MKDLEAENAKLKRMYADLALENTEVAPRFETVFAVAISGALQVRQPPRAAASRSKRHQAFCGQERRVAFWH